MNCHNSETYLKEAIDSVYAQTYGRWEIIFWDNASSDKSPSIAKSYDSRLNYHRAANKTNLYEARNFALKKASGEFIAFLDCDDLWMPDKLEKLIPLFDDPDVGLAYSDAIYFNNEGKSKRLYKTRNYCTGRCFSELLKNYFLCLQTVVIRRLALDDQTEWFDPRFNIAGDTDLFRRIAYGWKIDMVNEPLAKYRIHPSTLGSTQSDLLVYEIDCMIEKYNVIFKDFKIRFADEWEALKKERNLNKALKDLKSGNSDLAREAIAPYALSNIKLFLIYIATFLPEMFFSTAMKFRKIISPLKY